MWWATYVAGVVSGGRHMWWATLVVGDVSGGRR